MLSFSPSAPSLAPSSSLEFSAPHNLAGLNFIHAMISKIPENAVTSDAAIRYGSARITPILASAPDTASQGHATDTTMP